MSSTDTIERVAWQAYADACLEHDRRHAARAASEIQHLLPRPRRASELPGGRTLGR